MTEDVEYENSAMNDRNILLRSKTAIEMHTNNNNLINKKESTSWSMLLNMLFGHLQKTKQWTCIVSDDQNFKWQNVLEDKISEMSTITVKSVNDICKEIVQYETNLKIEMNDKKNPEKTKKKKFRKNCMVERIIKSMTKNSPSFDNNAFARKNNTNVNVKKKKKYLYSLIRHQVILKYNDN